MSPRKLLMLCLVAAVCGSAGTALAVQLWRAVGTDTTTSGVFAYLTEGEVTLMRDQRVVVRVPRLSDPADPADHKLVWTHSGDYLAFSSDATLRQDDPSEQQLIVVDARTGDVRRLGCPRCRSMTAVDDNVILAEAGSADGDRQLLRFDLAGSGAGTPTDLPSLAGRELLASGRRHVVTTESGEGFQQHVEVLGTDAGTVRALGDVSVYTYPLAAVNDAADDARTLFVAAFRADRLCSPSSVYVFTPAGDRHETDISRAVAEHPTPTSAVNAEYQYGAWVHDLWWGFDGHFHATIQPIACSSDPGITLATGTSSVWRLDGDAWFKESAGPATMQRPLAEGTNAVLVERDCHGPVPPPGDCGTGTLFREHDGARTVVAEDVMSISAPTPRPSTADPGAPGY